MFKLERSKQTPWIGLILLTLPVTFSVRGATQNDELLVDPTMPLSFQMAGDSGDSGFDFGASAVSGLLSGLVTRFELSSVLIRGDNRIAVINGQRVHEGDSFGDATVISIDADSVTLNVDGDIETLELYENSIKTLVKGED